MHRNERRHWLHPYPEGVISSGFQEKEGVWQEEKKEALGQRDVVESVSMGRSVRFQEDVTLAVPGCFADKHRIQNGELNPLFKQSS